MKYKVVRYKKKRKCPFETYTPKRRLKEHAEDAAPWIVRIGHDLSFAGGFIGFWVSSGFMILRSVFKAEEKIKRFSLNKKIVEIRIKNR